MAGMNIKIDQNIKIIMAGGFAAVLALTFAGHTAHAADVVIAAGETAGFHQKIARVICRSVKQAGQSCETKAVVGLDAAEPLAVLNDVQTNAVDLAVIQSDWQYHAVNGTGPVKFVHMKFDNLRSLFSLHSEPFTVIARRDSGINSVGDLAGKRVNIGSPGSDQRALLGQVMAAKGWTKKSFQAALELTAFEQTLALCHNRVQAIIAKVVHPDENVARALKLCNARLVDAADSDTNAIIKKNPFFDKAVIPAGLYTEQDKSVSTFGVTVTVVASGDLSDETAHAVVKAVFERLGTLKRMHPALRRLEPNDMMRRGQSAPVHPGAAKYFKQTGIL